jgi:hypothetical protein
VRWVSGSGVDRLRNRTVRVPRRPGLRRRAAAAWADLLDQLQVRAARTGPERACTWRARVLPSQTRAFYANLKNQLLTQ